MNVLVVCSGNGPTGISPIVQNQTESLQKLGIAMHTFTIVGKGWYGYLSALHKLRHLLMHQKYDLIHAHYGTSALIVWLAHSRLPLIVSFMGDDLLGTENEIGRISTASRMMVKLNVLLARRFYTHALVKNARMANILDNQRKLTLLPNGVDLTAFYPISKAEAREILQIQPNEKIAVFISSPNRPEKNYKLAKIAASSCQEMVRIIAVHGIPNHQLPLYYNMADLLLLTSYHEGSPNAIKEAMACNCPIVSTDVGDVRWVIGETEGCFITTFNPDDVANKINLAVDFSQTVGRTRGRQRILELGLDSETVAVKVAEVYKKVLNRDNR